MANDNKEISEIVKKCKILLLDIEGTTTSISFVKDKLFPYAEENVKQFLDSQWETDDVKEVVAALRKLALEDQEKSVDGVVVIPGEDASKEDQIEGLVNNVKWQMSSDRKAGALKQLQGMIWKQGYESGDIKGHVYDDVSSALEQWRSVDGQKVYIYSSGSVQAQKLLFGQSLAGDLLKYIDGHFDTAVGAKQEAASYTAIAEKIGVQPADVLFLTDIPKEAEAARVAGFHVALVSREGNAPLSSEATDAFAVLHSLAQLASNKRKTDPQDEQPAKVLKTDADVDVKKAFESLVPEEKVPQKNVQGEEEKMEVEEPSAAENAEEKAKVETVEKTETIIEDVTDVIEPLDAPMVDVVPVVIEADEVVSICAEAEKKTVEMDTEIIETVKSDEVATKPEESTKSDEVVTKPNAVESEPSAVAAKPDEVTKPEKEVTKADGVNETGKIESSEISNGTKESLVDAKPTESESRKTDVQKEETLDTKEQIESQVVKEKAKVAEETPPAVITDIEEITAENLGDVAEMIEDLEPIVEEPPNEDMDDLQNVGEVLEKECDEILSKVQDVTNLDNIPLKPLLNPIVEESMETELDAENMDSNDIVDRILDSELELEMKQCNDIDLNTVTEITDDAKVDESVETKLLDEKQEVEINAKVEEKITETSAPESMDMQSSQTDTKAEVDVNNKDTVETNEKTNSEKEENKETAASNDKLDNCDSIKSNDTAKSSDVESNEKTEIKENLDKKEEIKNNEQTDEKMETNNEAENKEQSEKLEEATKIETNNKTEETQVTKTEESKAQPNENNKDDLKTQPESTDTEKQVSEKATTEKETDKESQVNGKATNGDAVTVNGDASNAEELNSRLSVENGKEAVNGSNGDSVDSEKGQGDKEAEVSDIKVKTVATEEPRTDPIEQPTEA